MEQRRACPWFRIKTCRIELRLWSRPSKRDPSSCHPFMVFDQMRQTFAAHKAELLREHQGQHVVIQGQDIIGIGKTYEDALEIGYSRFGLGPFT